MAFRTSRHFVSFATDTRSGIWRTGVRLGSRRSGGSLDQSSWNVVVGLLGWSRRVPIHRTYAPGTAGDCAVGFQSSLCRLGSQPEETQFEHIASASPLYS